VRADDELLRRGGRQAVKGRRALAVALGALALGTGPARPAPFDGAAALRHLERVVALGPRPAGSPASAKTRAYILAELRAVSITARVEPFEADTPHGRLKMANIVAVLPGRRPDVILIGGHYRSEEHTSELQSRFDL